MALLFNPIITALLYLSRYKCESNLYHIETIRLIFVTHGLRIFFQYSEDNLLGSFY